MSDEFPSYEELQRLPTKEILIMVVQKLRSVSINQCNHLKHHETKEIADRKYLKSIKLIALSAILSGFITLATGLILIIVQLGL